MDFYVLRHGEAGKRLATASKDSERSLTYAGRNEVQEVAESLLKMKIRPDKIITSPLKRANETAEIVANVLKIEDVLEEWEELKPEGKRPEFYGKLFKIKEGSSILIVGHEPYLSLTIGEIISGTNCRIVLKKSGMAKIRLIDYSGSEPRGELRWLLTPKQLKNLA